MVPGILYLVGHGVGEFTRSSSHAVTRESCLRTNGKPMRTSGFATHFSKRKKSLSPESEEPLLAQSAGHSDATHQPWNGGSQAESTSRGSSPTHGPCCARVDSFRHRVESSSERNLKKEGELESDLKKLCKKISQIRRQRRGNCDPSTFRIPMASDWGLAHYGTLEFPSKQTRYVRRRAHMDKAKYIHLGKEGLRLPSLGIRNTGNLELRDVTTADIAPHRTTCDLMSYAARIADLMELQWKMPRPSVLISISGGAADFKLSASLYKDLYAITRAAEAAGAWGRPFPMHAACMPHTCHVPAICRGPASALAGA